MLERAATLAHRDAARKPVMMKPRLFRLLVIVCIAAVSLGSMLLISSSESVESHTARAGK